MAFQGVEHARCKVVVNNDIIEKVASFDYLGCNVSYCYKEDVNIKITNFRKRVAQYVEHLKKQNAKRDSTQIL